MSSSQRHPELGPKTRQLVSVLEDLEAHLTDREELGDSFWAARLLEARRRLVGSDYSGILYLLSLFGGMGSFNDLLLTPAPDRLRSQAFMLADAIRREEEGLLSRP